MLSNLKSVSDHFYDFYANHVKIHHTGNIKNARYKALWGYEVKINVTNAVEQKFKVGLMMVVFLGIVSLAINTILINNVSEDVRISITSFFAAAFCVLGLKFLIYRINK